MKTTGFPTFLVRNLENDKMHLIHGYRRYGYFERLLDEIADSSLKKRRIEKSEVEIFGFISRWGKVATQEVATLIDTTKDEAYEMLKSLSDKSLIYSRKAGNDYFWLAKIAVACDPNVGVCKAQL